MSYTFDTNVLVYAFISTDDPRAEQARELIRRASIGNGAALLFQALAEFSYVAIRKFRLSASDVSLRVAALLRVIPIAVAAEDDLPNALTLVNEHKIGLWDALLCTTASRLNIQYFLSEDLQDGRRFGGLTVVNPFRAENAELTNRVLRG